jgi:hypothetical protein
MNGAGERYRSTQVKETGPFCQSVSLPVARLLRRLGLASMSETVTRPPSYPSPSCSNSLGGTHYKDCLLLMSNTERLDGLGQANCTLIWHIFGSQTRLIEVRRSQCPGQIQKAIVRGLDALVPPPRRYNRCELLRIYHLNVWQYSSLPPISGSVKPSLLHYRYTRFVPATGQRNQAVFASETMIA